MATADSASERADWAILDFRTARFTSSWREEALARICELYALIDSWAHERMDAESNDLLENAKAELDHATQAAQARRGRLNGAVVQRVHGHLDAAEVLVLRGAPLTYVHGQTACLVAYARRHLVASDLRCQAAEQVLEAAGLGARAIGVPTVGPDAPADGAPMPEADRMRLVAAVHGAMAEARNEQMRVRSFRNLLLIFAVVLTALVIGVGALGALAPEKLPVCFQPTQVSAGQAESPRLVCPIRASDLPARATQAQINMAVGDTVTPWDVPMIEFLGIIAASVAAATAFRRVRGTSTPYSLPATLALLKLPLGALTALLGLILLRANFVAGLSALDNSAQIIGWAVVFGYAQQAFTQFVDRKTQDVLQDVGGAQRRETPTVASPQRR